ncbi:hypothetical protein I7E32_10005 [Alcaligenes faecalis]|nr:MULTISPECIES: hypothetical protein [Alcaligenes]ARP53423.1 hypothetical protein ALFP_1536 [Alcaligenes faecalis]ERI34678.1 hypothetical protein N879_03835 [Alcaligenes sp. EGD-AK7]MBH0310700.1 hypothetical protein [Alcaligenes faecalis]
MIHDRSNKVIEQIIMGDHAAKKWQYLAWPEQNDFFPFYKCYADTSAR